MLTPVRDKDDRRRVSQGLVVSVAQKNDGTLRLSLDRVSTTSATLPNRWDFKVFNGHFKIDQNSLRAVENELNKAESERSDDGIGVPDDVLRGI